MTQSIAHLQTREDLITAFKSIRSRLDENGILIMTQGTTHLTLQDKFRFDLVVSNKDFSRVFVRDINSGFQTVNILDIYHSAKENKMITNSVHIKIILDDEYRSLLSNAGFSEVHIYGGVAKDNNECVGFVGLFPLTYDTAENELFYGLFEEYYGKGYATEIGTAVIKYGFKNMNINKIVATVNKDNEVSKRVLDKIGMSFEYEIEDEEDSSYDGELIYSIKSLG